LRKRCAGEKTKVPEEKLLSISRKLDRPPIIMGHSFGGAFTQILLDRGLGAAGVAIDSAAVRGVLTLPWSTLKSALLVLKGPATITRRSH
jgi:pimeloyl-ACP methyl ester carboxylesterase